MGLKKFFRTRLESLWNQHRQSVSLATRNSSNWRSNRECKRRRRSETRKGHTSFCQTKLWGIVRHLQRWGIQIKNWDTDRRQFVPTDSRRISPLDTLQENWSITDDINTNQTLEKIYGRLHWSMERIQTIIWLLRDKTECSNQKIRNLFPTQRDPIRRDSQLPRCNLL